MAVIFFLLFLAMAWFGLSEVENESKALLKNQLTAVLSANAEVLKNHIELNRSQVKTWAENKDVHKELLALIGLADKSALLKSAELARLRERLVPVCKQLGFPGFVVFDGSGLQVGALFDPVVGRDDLKKR